MVEVHATSSIVVIQGLPKDSVEDSVKRTNNEEPPNKRAHTNTTKFAAPNAPIAAARAPNAVAIF